MATGGYGRGGRGAAILAAMQDPARRPGAASGSSEEKSVQPTPGGQQVSDEKSPLSFRKEFILFCYNRSTFAYMNASVYRNLNYAFG